MTDNEILQLAQRETLLIFDWDDEACERLYRTYDPKHDGTAMEAKDEDQFLSLLEDPLFELAGAIRYSTTDVRPVFRKLRVS